MPSRSTIGRCWQCNFDHAPDDAEQGLRRAIALDPDYPDPHINLAILLTATGRHAEASSEMRRAQFLDPASSILPPLLAYLHLMSRRYDDAYAEYRAAMLLRYGEGLHWDMMSAAIGASRWHDAARSLSAILGEPIGISRDARNPGAELGIHIHRLGRQLAANERNDVDPYTQACFFAQTRDADRAFAALDRAAIEQSMNLMFAFVDPRLDPIRDDPRFADRLDQFGLLR
ncbi:MAG TPA: tetratricopeptide repeat protein [Thermoanaerobaculia bacterium]|jgi:tetratricopeptide (TPR) repeat protein|nr:tetratricopeptide repeat protein [Thermoanaerobaculia bacterium]